MWAMRDLNPRPSRCKRAALPTELIALAYDTLAYLKSRIKKIAPLLFVGYLKRASMGDIKDVKIIYEDDEMLVINKPAGIRVHEDGFGQGETVVDWFTNYYPSAQTVGEPMKLPDGRLVPRSGIVHRLDRDTSGVLVLAKTAPAFDYLKSQFKNRQIKKTYLAIVHGVIKDDVEKIIDLPIGRSGSDSRKRVASKKAFGKLREAITYYRPVERFAQYTLVEARPETGRTHQLRVHFKAIQYPIVGDQLYAPTLAWPEGLERQALHASKLSLICHDGMMREFEAPLPADMASLLDKLR